VEAPHLGDGLVQEGQAGFWRPPRKLTSHLASAVRKTAMAAGLLAARAMTEPAGRISQPALTCQAPKRRVFGFSFFGTLVRDVNLTLQVKGYF
jgi:hypothetical protein